jgi:hypothetical protein
MTKSDSKKLGDLFPVLFTISYLLISSWRILVTSQLPRVFSTLERDNFVQLVQFSSFLKLGVMACILIPSLVMMNKGKIWAWYVLCGFTLNLGVSFLFTYFYVGYGRLFGMAPGSFIFDVSLTLLALVNVYALSKRNEAQGFLKDGTKWGFVAISGMSFFVLGFVLNQIAMQITLFILG